MKTLSASFLAIAISLSCLRSPEIAAGSSPPPEVRGTWVTTTANDAISTPEKTAATMKRLREIGLNTVYVECWKNGYTQFPSKVLEKTIGVDRRPNLMPQDPSETPEATRRPARDLLQETLVEAHRNGLVYIAWFEYGFMAAHKSTDNHLRRMKPDWLSRDQSGNEVAPNGFVWMNPLHPETRKFLLDLVLEAVDRYDLDGIQLDDRIVWPYVTMGYDDYTKKIYAQEHGGKQPPTDYKDPAWMRWRADKVNEYARIFVAEVRKARPGLLVSLSPAVYPWCYDYYLLEWPKWAAWNEPISTSTPESLTARWDEFVPQVYRMNYAAFETTWLDQVEHMKKLGGGRTADLIAGIRVVGDGPDSTWEDLRRSMDLARSTGGGGHVHWFSRGVLDLFPEQLTEFYNAATVGQAPHPKFGADWRPPPVPLKRGAERNGRIEWSFSEVPAGRYQLFARSNGVWTLVPREHNDPANPQAVDPTVSGTELLPPEVDAAEFHLDRRPEMSTRQLNTPAK